MRIEQTIARGRRLSLTSLIDVIFLLLLFFMLSSTFTKFSEIEIKAGKSGSTSRHEKPGILISLEQDRWRVNGANLDQTTAINTLQELSATSPQTAILMVKGETTSQELVLGLELLQSIKNLSLSVAR